MTPAIWALEGAAALAAGLLLVLRGRVAAPKVVAETRGLAGVVCVRDAGRFRELVFVDDDGRREMVQARVTRSEPPISDLAYTDGLHLGVLSCARPVDAGGPRRVMAIGGGPLVVPRQLVALHGDIQITVVENDAGVIEIARTHFGFRDDPRLAIHVGDGREALAAEAAESLDAVLVDAFGLGTVPRALVSEAFFRVCHDRLRDGGALVVNLAGTPNGARGIGLRRIAAGVRAVFGAPAVAVFGVPLPGEGAGAPLEGARNTIVIARKRADAPTPEELTEAARRLAHRGLPRLLPHLPAILARPTALDTAGLEGWPDPHDGASEGAALPIR